jgi:trans-aconitate 2-methyltransferase
VSEPTGRYTFGDTDRARERLELVAAVFGPPSRAFLAAAVPASPRHAVDLGCGPGVTTRLVHEVTGARRTTGLDRSAEFLAAARRDAPAGVGFARWQDGDPLPGEPPDLIYARLLLAHLPEPGAAVARWAARAAAGGRLLADEVERIETDDDVLTEYLAMVTALVRSGGADMFAGPLLARLPLPAGCAVTQDEVVPLPVPPATAARMFALNLAVWGATPWARKTYGPQAVARIGDGLRAISDGAAAGPITWQMRQVVVRRTGPPAG